MKKLVLIIAFLGSGMNLLAYDANPVENDIVVEKNIEAVDDPNDLVLAYEVRNLSGNIAYFHTIECVNAYKQHYPSAIILRQVMVEYDKVFVCLESSSGEETS